MDNDEGKQPSRVNITPKDTGLWPRSTAPEDETPLRGPKAPEGEPTQGVQGSPDRGPREETFREKVAAAMSPEQTGAPPVQDAPQRVPQAAVPEAGRPMEGKAEQTGAAVKGAVVGAASSTRAEVPQGMQPRERSPATEQGSIREGPSQGQQLPHPTLEPASPLQQEVRTPQGAPLREPMPQQTGQTGTYSQGAPQQGIRGTMQQAGTATRDTARQTGASTSGAVQGMAQGPPPGPPEQWGQQTGGRQYQQGAPPPAGAPGAVGQGGQQAAAQTAYVPPALQQVITPHQPTVKGVHMGQVLLIVSGALFIGVGFDNLGYGSSAGPVFLGIVTLLTGLLFMGMVVMPNLLSGISKMLDIIALGLSVLLLLWGLIVTFAAGGLEGGFVVSAALASAAASLMRMGMIK